MEPTRGITAHGAGLNGTAWNILGQTYTPVQWSPASFAFDTLFPPGTFVPEHVHPAQDEFIRVLSGHFAIRIDGQAMDAAAGDLVSLPMGIPHEIRQVGDTPATALFWVAPSLRLYDLFTAISGVADPSEVVRLAALHDVHFSPPPT